MTVTARHALPGIVCGVLTVFLLEIVSALLLANSFTALADDPSEARLPQTPLHRMQGTFAGPDGTTHTFGELHGKVVVLNRWATWCPPCMKEMPSLESLWKTFQGNDKIRIYCISEESVQDVGRHPLLTTLDMPVYVFTSPLPEELDAPALPATYIFDRRGRAVFAHTGMANWDAPEVVAFLRDLLQEDGSTADNAPAPGSSRE